MTPQKKETGKAPYFQPLILCETDQRACALASLVLRLKAEAHASYQIQPGCVFFTQKMNVTCI